MRKNDPRLQDPFYFIGKPGFDPKERRTKTYHVLNRLVKKGYVEKMYTDRGVEYRLKDDYLNLV